MTRSFGMRTVTVVPFPGSLSISIPPPWTSTSPLGQWQSEAGSLTTHCDIAPLGLTEFLHGFCKTIGIHADTRIGDTNEYRTIVGDFSADRNRTTGRRELHRVAQQINEYLLYPQFIGTDDRGFAIDLVQYLDVT